MNSKILIGLFFIIGNKSISHATAHLKITTTNNSGAYLVSILKYKGNQIAKKEGAGLLIDKDVEAPGDYELTSYFPYNNTATQVNKTIHLTNGQNALYTVAGQGGKTVTLQ